MTILPFRKQDPNNDWGPAGDLADEVGEDEQPTVGEFETTDVPNAIDPPAPSMPRPDLAARWEGRKLILAPWMKSLEAVKYTAWWHLRNVGYLLTYHGWKSPKYLLRAVIRTIVGAWRTVAAFWGWLLDAEGRRMSADAYGGGDHQAWQKARKEWHETVGRRIKMTLGCLVGGAVVVALAYLFAPPEIVALVLVATVAVLVKVGAPEDAPLLDPRPVDKGKTPPRLTRSQVLDALAALGVSKIDAALKDNPGAGIRFHQDPMRAEGGRGFVAVPELPGGVTAGDVMERRERLASGLKRPLGCVWPGPVKSAHPGLLELFVADEDLNTAAQPTWPLLKRGEVDLFKPQPFGTDERSRIVNTELAYVSGVIGSIPRIGKTFSLRLLLLIAALDVRSKVYAFDKKGSGDLSPLEHVAHAYTVGDDPEDIQLDLAYLRELREEMRRRYKVLRKLPKERAPETKVTPELANDRSLGLEPIVMGVDECQFWFTYPVKEVREEFIEICVDLAKRGPAAMIVPLYATQKPDASSIPTGISNNAAWRFCLKVMDATANNQVLGSGQYANGVRATMFSFEDKGIGYLLADGANAKVTKTFYVDAPSADRVALRAKALRQAANRLTGYAAGDEEPELAPQPMLLDDLPKVFADVDRLHSEQIIERLQALRPGPYDGWTTPTFAAALRDQLGIGTTGIKIGGTNRQGLRRAAVLAAVGAALDPGEAPDDGDCAESEQGD